MIAAIALCIFSLVSANENDLIRKQYHAAAEDKEQLEMLEASCSQVRDKQNSTTLGYCTMVHFLKAKNAFNPYRKFSEFNSGKAMLDSLIHANPENIELRYLRHSIQDRAPGFLGYKDQLEEDETFMKANLSGLSDSSTYQLIYSYLNKPTE